MGLMVIDSIVELRPRDTVTRVRYFRASGSVQSTSQAAATQTLTDTAAATVEETGMSPIAAESNKSGVTGLRPHVRTACIVIFAIFFMFLLLCVIKYLLLPYR